ncbi:MAG: aminotransferase class IV [Actinomycetota bacterium]|nr:aminotransferase class IV [Actinomycetota bacterium]
MAVLGSVLIDGRPVDPEHAAISVFDIGFQRGYGCFEAMRSYEGAIFRLEPHLDRLELSATKLRLPTPDRDSITGWCHSTAEAAGECVVRVFVSGGSDPRTPGTDSRVVVFAEAVRPGSPTMTVQSRTAPWHTDGDWSELTGAKALSYGFNLAASVAAQDDGFDDALLIGRRGHVLEGPTFSIGWITDRVFHTPGLEIGILESITRTAVIEVAGRLGMAISEGVYGIDDVLSADEVFAMSTVREVLPITQIDEREFGVGVGTRELQDGFTALVDEELHR